MVKFGRQIKHDRIDEWKDGYIDYDALKVTLNAMVKSGHSYVFSEDALYAPISVAYEPSALVPEGPHEIDFMAQVDAEIEKVNKFTSRLHGELDTHVAQVQRRHEQWIAAGKPDAQQPALAESVEECSSALQQFEDYINLNYLGFSKILKKHDKRSSCPFRMPYLLKIQNQTFVEGKMAHIIKTISDMNASIHGEAVKAGAQAFDPNQKGGASFVRRTTKCVGARRCSPCSSG
jgi:SPX domain protein involved in polyphosphate accumulation